MRVLTLDRVGHWTRGTNLLALGALAWVVFAAGGAFWTGVLAGGIRFSLSKGDPDAATGP